MAGAKVFEVVTTAGTYFMFLEACFGLIAICLPTLSAVLHMDILSRFLHGFTSLFSPRQRSQDTKASWGDGQERIYAQPAVPTRTHQGLEVEDSMKSFELQSAKAIRVTDDLEQTRSMV